MSGHAGRLVLALLVLLASVTLRGGAQAAPAAAPGPARAAPAISLITLGQGDQIWERFGHNFLAVEDSASGHAVAYNWGVFDFAAPDFLTRFLIGDTRYWMEANTLADVLRVYQQYNRSITVQRLRLTPAQADSLVAFLEWNARPENRYYRYDYFRDNCSTRLRDALDLALGGALRRATEPRVTNLTYRSESVRLTDEAPAAQLGIDVALGQPADVVLSAWEAMFVPMRMQEFLRDVEVPDASGALVPLVAAERVVFQARRVPERERAPSLVAELTVVGLTLAAVIALLAHLAMRGRERAATAMAGIAGAWGGIAGTMGVVLLLAWTATQHVFWYRNENLFHFNPAALALLVVLPLAVTRPRWWPAARFIAFALAGLSLAGAALKLFPWMIQDNWEIVMLALPVHLAVAFGVARLSAAAMPPVAPGRGRRRAT